jgi:hypothetical protein
MVIMGPPAAGKSGIADTLARWMKALILDSDDIKAELPEYENGLGAARVHLESKDVTDGLITDATQRGDNLVLPIVGSSDQRIAEVIGPLKAAGYHVTLIHNTLPIEVAARRSMVRFREQGRVIPMDYLTGLEGKLDSAHEGGRSLADEHATYSNDVRRGDNPRLQQPSTVDPLHEARVSEAGGDQRPGRAGRRDDGDASPEGGGGDAGQPGDLAHLIHSMAGIRW